MTIVTFENKNTKNKIMTFKNISTTVVDRPIVSIKNHFLLFDLVFCSNFAMETSGFYNLKY